MRQLPRMMLATLLIVAFGSTSFIAGADDEEKQRRAVAVEDGVDQAVEVRYHFKALQVYVNELEKAEEAERQTDPKYAEKVGYLETLRRLLEVTKDDFGMGRASADDYRRASEELAELELQSIVRHEERLKAAKAHVERMTELAKTVKARREVGAIGEREMLEGKAAQEKAERLLRSVERPETRSGAEVTFRQRAAEPLQQHYRMVTSLTAVGAKGGEPDKQAEAGRAYYQAQAGVAMAKGQPAEALSALRAATFLADRALMATQASFDAGTAKPSDVVAAAKAREDVFRQFWEAYRVYGDPQRAIELPDDPFFEGLGVKRAAR